MNVKGLKITDILNIDLNTFNNLEESDLRHITSRLVSASNKRIRSLESKDINSPAYSDLGEEKRFSTKLKPDVTPEQRVNQLRKEFARARRFLTAETSTISGYNKFTKRIRKRIARELNLSEKVLKDKIDIGKMYDILHKLQEKGLVDSYRKSKGSMQARSMIADIMVKHGNVDEGYIMDWFEDNASKLYEEQERKNKTELDIDDLDDSDFIL